MVMDSLDAVTRRAIAAPSLGLLLDYDGTLVPLRVRPELAEPDGELLALLARLAQRADMDVHIVSGRPQADIEQYFGNLPLGLHAEHGLWSRRAYGTWRARPMHPATWRPRAEALLEGAVTRVEGTWLERKTVGFAWHWRLSVLPQAQREVEALREAVRALEPEGAELIEGNGIFEIRPAGTGKDRVARDLVAADPGRSWIAAGDDHTDEELFAALPADAVRIKVGGGSSVAEFRVAGPEEIRALLVALAG
jgi:trehalose 6-phosphate synthase/phosphatase